MHTVSCLESLISSQQRRGGGRERVRREGEEREERKEEGEQEGEVEGRGLGGCVLKPWMW